MLRSYTYFPRFTHSNDMKFDFIEKKYTPIFKLGSEITKILK